MRCPKKFMPKFDGPNRLWMKFGNKRSGLDRIPRGPDRCLISLGWDWGQNLQKIARGPYFFFWSPRGSHVKWYRPNRLWRTLGEKIPRLDTILGSPDEFWTRFEKKVSGVDKNPSWLNEGFIGCPKGFMEKPGGPNWLGRTLEKKSSGLDTILWGPDRLWTGFGKKVSGVDKNPFWLNEGLIGCPKGLMEKSYGPNRLGRRLGTKHFRVW